MDECLFCRIVAGEIPAERIAENDHAIAFADIAPTAPVHFLVVPRRHVASLDELADEDREVSAGCLELVRDAAREAGLMPGGYRTLANTGPDSGQVVMHLHFHVVGGRELGWPPG